MKNITVIFLALLALTLGGGLVAMASDKAEEAAEAAAEETTLEPVELVAPEDGLAIDYIKGNSPRGLSVEFNHSSHEGYDCASCHHKMFQLKGQAQPRSCSACHDNFDVNNTKGYRSYFKAMHKIRQAPQSSRPSCVACHTTEFENDKELTGCTASACHGEGLY